MNTDTGRIYRTAEEIEAARKRGEPLVEVSPLVAEQMEVGRDTMNRKARRRQLAELRKAKRRAHA